MRSILVFVVAILTAVFVASSVDAKPDGSLGKDCAKCHKDDKPKPPSSEPAEKVRFEAEMAGDES